MSRSSPVIRNFPKEVSYRCHHETASYSHVGDWAMRDSTSKSFQSACLVLIYGYAVREDRPGSQQAEALVEVAFEMELRNSLKCVWIAMSRWEAAILPRPLRSPGLQHIANLGVNTGCIRAPAAWRSSPQMWSIQAMVSSSDTYADWSRTDIRRIAIRVTLAHQRALSFRQAYIGEDTCCLSVARTVV